jgi:hypothetical protein
MDIDNRCVDVALFYLRKRCSYIVERANWFSSKRRETVFKHHGNERVILNDQNSALHILFKRS